MPHRDDAILAIHSDVYDKVLLAISCSPDVCAWHAWQAIGGDGQGGGQGHGQGMVDFSPNGAFGVPAGMLQQVSKGSRT